MMNEIIPNLFIGDYQDTVDRPKDMVSINVAFEHLDTLPDSIYMPFFFPLPDGRARISIDILNLVVKVINRELNKGKRVLVNCNQGMERAPLTVVWFLTKHRGMTLDDAYTLVKKQRPQTLDRREWVGLI